MHLIIQILPQLLSGFSVTVALWGTIICIGVPFGIILGVVAARFSSEIQSIIKGAHYMTKVVPVLVLLFWLHYPLQGLLGVVVNPFWTAGIALGIINMIGVAYDVMHELLLLPKSYREAGQMLGLNSMQIVRSIELPILVRRVVPNIITRQASMLEYTLLASLISVPEVFRVIQSINAMVYRPVVLYSLLVVCFAVILTPIYMFVSRWEKQYFIRYD